MSTSLTLHLQTRVVSIVEALAKSAIAEIRKVIDEGTEVSCLEMSRSKKENETLKRRLLQMEKELEAARKGIKIRAVAGDRIRTVKEQIGDEIRGADAPSSDNYVSEEEQPFSLDGAFGKECSVSLWKEEAPMQPVTSEEGTQTGEDRAGLFSSKVEQFEENLEDSEPHGGLKICDGGFESGRDSTERRYGEESDTPPAPAEVTREPYSPPAAAGSRRDGRALPDATEGPAEPHAGPAPPPPQNAAGPAPPPPQNTAGPAPPPPQNAAGPAPPLPQNAAGPAPPPPQNAAGPQPEGPRRYFLRDRNADAAKGQEGAGKGQERAGTKPLACAHCGRSFSYFGSFQKHVRTCPSGSGNRLCQKAEPEQRESVEAGQQALGNGWLSCEHCTKRFSCLYDLETHLAVHSEKPFRCNNCGKYYLEKWHLNSHLCSLTGEKPYKCIDCGNGFSQEAHLSLHQCSQRREKPYSCTNSGGDSSQKSKFESQHRIYREGNFYSCAACERHFVNMNTFDRYLCIRTVKKPHRCFECGKRFTERSSLNLHQRTIHAGEKPYSCAECGKNFTKKVHFQKHQIIHAGEKPYRCLECGKRFTEKGHLKKHHLIHTGVKPYSCRECGKWFYHKAGLNSHERNHRRKAK